MKDRNELIGGCSRAKSLGGKLAEIYGIVLYPNKVP